MDPTRSAVAHLLRRTGFGASPAEVDRLAALGYEGAVDWVLDVGAPDAAADAVPVPTFDTEGYLAAVRGNDEAARQAAMRKIREERRALVVWWVQRMVVAERPFREKLTFLWHEHFATSLEKVELPVLLFRQRATLERLGTGRFDALLDAMARDGAMLIWLDGRESTAEAPNENFARELLELFTLGHGGHDGQPYTERDVAELARALTGWVIDRSTGDGVLRPGRHDSGVKDVLGTSGRLSLPEAVEITTSHPSCAPHVVARLWSRLARPATADDTVVRELARDFARDLDIATLLRRMLLHDDFLAPATRSALVRPPLDLVVGTLRALGGRLEAVESGTFQRLGQIPFFPPDVSGWPSGVAWLSTASAAARIDIASSIAADVDLADLQGAAPAARPALLAEQLSLDGWTDATSSALRDAPDARAALALAIASPEHVVA